LFQDVRPRPARSTEARRSAFIGQEMSLLGKNVPASEKRHVRQAFIKMGCKKAGATL
jgi:hypothetical protein